VQISNELTVRSKVVVVRARLKRDGTRAETRFGLSVKRTSPFKSAGVSVQSTAGSRGVRISSSIARSKRDGTRAETRFGLSVKRSSPFKSAGVSVQSTTGSRGVRISSSIARSKRDDTHPETRFGLSAKRTSPFKSAGVSVQSTNGSRGVRISGQRLYRPCSDVQSKAAGYPLYFHLSRSLPLPCVTVCY